MRKAKTEGETQVNEKQPLSIHFAWINFNGLRFDGIVPDRKLKQMLKTAEGWQRMNPLARVHLWVDSQQGTADNADVNLARLKAKTKFFAKDNPIVIQCVRKSKWYHQCVVDYDEHGAPSTFDRETMPEELGEGGEEKSTLFDILHDGDNYTIVDLYKLFIINDSLSQFDTAVWSDIDIDAKHNISELVKAEECEGYFREDTTSIHVR